MQLAKGSISLLLVFATSAAAALVNERGYEPSKCTNTRCIQAVTCSAEKKAIQSAHRADCSSFQRHTVYPSLATQTVTETQAVVTVTDTVTPTTTITTRTTATVTPPPISTYTFVSQSNIDQRLLARGVTAITGAVSPSHVPSYASKPCSNNASQYASACSCWGIKPTTVTAPRSTTTKTVTVPGLIATVTATAEPATITDTTTATFTADAPTATVTETVDCLSNGDPSRAVDNHTPVPNAYNVYCRSVAQINGEFYYLTSSKQSGFQNCVNLCGSYNECASAQYSVNRNGGGDYCTLYTIGSGNREQRDDALYFVKQ